MASDQLFDPQFSQTDPATGQVMFKPPTYASLEQSAPAAFKPAVLRMPAFNQQPAAFRPPVPQQNKFALTVQQALRNRLLGQMGRPQADPRMHVLDALRRAMNAPH